MLWTYYPAFGQIPVGLRRAIKRLALAARSRLDWWSVQHTDENGRSERGLCVFVQPGQSARATRRGWAALRESRKKLERTMTASGYRHWLVIAPTDRVDHYVERFEDRVHRLLGFPLSAIPTGTAEDMGAIICHDSESNRYVTTHQYPDRRTRSGEEQWSKASKYRVIQLTRLASPSAPAQQTAGATAIPATGMERKLWAVALWQGSITVQPWMLELELSPTGFSYLGRVRTGGPWDTTTEGRWVGHPDAIRFAARAAAERVAAICAADGAAAGAAAAPESAPL